MVWLSGVTTYEQAEAAFERIGGYRVPRTSIWQQSQKQGARLVAYQAQQATRVSIERIQLAAPGADHEQRKGVSIDGGKVNIRGEGWKEFKLGAVFDVETHEIPDEQSPDLLERARAVDPAYVGVLGSAQGWLKTMSTALFRGEIWKITHDLDQAGLADHSRYFHTHQRRMQYLEFRENEYPLGSGCVESGIKQFKARLTGAGMRWSRSGADRMLVIRAAILSDTFDTLWAAA